MSKLQLKQEAKGLLLKGCYKMAFNKYKRLIEMGSEGFSKRDWSIVHLNQAICLQFQEDLPKAIETIDRSLQIDPTYQKAYYRRLQIMRQLGQYENAINSIPIWLKNAEVHTLLKDVKEEYLNSMGMDQILSNILLKKNDNIQFVKQSHLKFYQRIVQAIDSKCSIQHLRNVGEKVASYYSHLKKENYHSTLQHFLFKIHHLLIRQHQSKDKEPFKTLLNAFWQIFTAHSQPINCKEFVLASLKDNEQFKIVKFAPLSSRLLHFLEALLHHRDLEDECAFELALQLSSNLSLSPSQISHSKQIFNIIEQFTSALSVTEGKNVAWLKKAFLLIDSLIKFHLLIEPTLRFETVSKASIYYLHHHFVHQNQNAQFDNTPFKGIKQEYILSYFNANVEQFLVIYMFEHFIHKLNRDFLKQSVPLIQEELQMLRNLKQIGKKRGDLSREYEIIYTCLLVKIDVKNCSPKINIDSILGRDGNKRTDKSLSDLQINVLLLLAIADKQNLMKILSHKQSITDVVQQFINLPFLQQIQNIKTVTSFVYLLVINLEEEQEQHYATKMGTTIQQIRNAKKIQGEKTDLELNRKISEKQQGFKQFICKNWQEMIPQYCDLLMKIKDEGSLIKWGKFLYQIGKKDHSRFHNSKILNAALQCFRVEKKEVGRLLSIVCKKINVELIKYEYLQSIANVLLYNVEKDDDELVIFESLLGLINLTSNSNNTVKIDSKTIINSVFEENKYIVHAACSLLNNLMVYDDDPTKQTRLREIIQKYVRYYREEMENDEGLPLSDYSHPSRVYSTLLSLAMVLDLAIEQFEEWLYLQNCLLKIKTSRVDILYKSVWFMSMKEKLKGKWWVVFQKDLAELRMVDYQRWQKLQPYLKR